MENMISEKSLRVLIVEDSEYDVILLLLELRKKGYEPDFERVDTRESMRAALQRQEWDIVISDHVMPRFSGFEALTVLKESGLDLPFIIVSGNIGEDIAVAAMKAGAHDYILKDNLMRLVPAIERELGEAEVRRERRREEEERKRLSAAVDAAADAIVITSKGVILYVNPAFEKLTGYSRDETLGRDLHMLDSGRHDDAFYQGLRESLMRNGVWNGRLVNKKKDGTLYEEDCTYVPVKGPSGEIHNYISIKRDMTEKVRLEAVAQAVDSMNNIGYIFSGVRHEIGNPINTIIMNLSLLLNKLEQLDKPSIATYVSRALEETAKVEYLLRSLRNYNMFEQLELQDVSMTDFMDKFLALVREDFARRGVTVTAIVAPDAEHISADPRALQQILLNLIANASDAVEGQKSPRVAIQASRAENMIRIAVEDNGTGIPESGLKDLFKPFRTTKKHGTGLGLVIVKKMLARMNGTIDVRSRTGVGTVVDIFIPACAD
jgi:PAS domain S-box-containing protein